MREDEEVSGGGRGRRQRARPRLLGCFTATSLRLGILICVTPPHAPSPGWGVSAFFLSPRRPHKTRTVGRHHRVAVGIVPPPPLPTTCSSWSGRSLIAKSALASSPPERSTGGDGDGVGNKKKKKKKNAQPTLTLQELSQKVASNPARYLDGTTTTTGTNPSSNNKKKGKRTRQRVLNPKQTYLYRSQRNQLVAQGEPSSSSSKNRTGDGTASGMMELGDSAATGANVMAVARQLGLLASAQHCQPDLHNDMPPTIVGHIRIGDESLEPSSACFAYVVHKPSGWSVLGSGGGGGGGSGGTSTAGKGLSAATSSVESDEASTSKGPLKLQSSNEKSKNRSSHRRRVKIVESDGTTDFLEYSELDVVALLSPDELDEYLADTTMGHDGLDKVLAKDATGARDNNEDDDNESVDDNEASPLVEITVLQEEEDDDKDMEDEFLETDPVRAANLQRIAARKSASESSTDDPTSNLMPAPRPSLVAWLKDNVGEHTSIRGGTYWAAVAGATRVDDSGLVLVAPRHKVDSVNVDAVEYTAVMGTGDHLAKTSSKDSDKSSEVEIEVVSRLRKGRSEDVVHVVNIRSTNPATSCSSIVAAAQDKLQQGIRGDPEANPFDRRASRRLVHCRRMSVSSAIAGSSTLESESIPLDIAVLLERGQPTKTLFEAGSFLGRASLRNSTATTAYREINSAADGCPGWTVDRYDKWLFVQHDPQKGDLGPLPSIHDGNTAGVYLLEQSSPDRSTDGSIRPKLLEGKAAPERFPILENGITYLVSMQDMSTGIFLDQRPQRAWLARNCQPGTRVLNCFAHSGAYSVAAAAAGASTVSVDLSRKWLERLPDQMAANSIAFDERHDAIYGDCFDWLGRLAKRGEKYDIVILDPPSSSVGGRKKRRWSIKNDMDELVSLAAGLVKKGGWLWTTTNSASIHPIKFARLCKKGLDDAGMLDAKLERVQPMPGDFPTIGPQAVKNLVWRIP